MNQDLSVRIRRLEKEKVMRVSYSKRLNILVQGLKEQENDETKEQAKTLFDNFLSEALEITLDFIKIVDLHRLRNIPFAKQVKLSLDLSLKNF